MGKLQNEDFKTEAQLLSAGGAKSQLLNDDKIYITGDGLNKTLKEAIDDGDLAAGGGVGSPSIFALLNAEDEDVTGWTNASINTGTPIAGVASYDLTMPGNSPAQAVDERHLGRLCQFKLYNRITSGSLRYQLKDQSSNVLAEAIVSESNQVIGQFYMPDTVTSVTLHWIDESSATGVSMDDFFIDSDPLSFQTTIKSGDYMAAGVGGMSSNNLHVPYYNNVYLDNLKGIVTITNTSADGFEITANEKCRLSVDASYLGDPGGFNNGLAFILNATAGEKDAAPFGTSTMQKCFGSGFPDGVSEYASISGFITMEPGDVATLISHSTNVRTGNNDDQIRVHVEADTKNLITSDSGTENVFSARIQNNGTASVLSESYPFIDSVSRTGAGEVTINFKSGFFTEIPSVTLETYNNVGVAAYTASLGTVSASSITLETYDVNTTGKVDRNIEVIVQRQGDDYKDPHAFNLVQLQDQNENTFAAKIANNGTASLTSQSGNFIQSVSRISTGVVDVVFNSGIFTQTPSACGAVFDATDMFVMVDDANSDQTKIRINTINVNGTLFDRQFDIHVTKQGADYVPPSGVSAGPMQAVAVAVIKDVKPSGTSGGTFPNGSYQTRVLNTISGSGFASLNGSNQFTLQAGTYEIDGTAPAFQVDQHRAKVRNITDGTDAILGTSEYSRSIYNGYYSSRFKGTITITESKTFEIQHRGTLPQATTGFGVPSGFGDDETYTQVTIRKLR